MNYTKNRKYTKDKILLLVIILSHPVGSRYAISISSSQLQYLVIVA